jgi:hypothetical protein
MVVNYYIHCSSSSFVTDSIVKHIVLKKTDYLIEMEMEKTNMGEGSCELSITNVNYQ